MKSQYFTLHFIRFGCQLHSARFLTRHSRLGPTNVAFAHTYLEALQPFWMGSLNLLGKLFKVFAASEPTPNIQFESTQF